MPRFYLPPESWDSGLLAGDEARHLSQVMRIKPGATVAVFDGLGRRAEAEVLTATRSEVALRVGDSQSPAQPLPAVTLAQAVPKGKNMELIVQKAVELGVARIQPLVTRHTVVQPGEGKSEKWRRIALEACKQCGQDTLPDIADPLPFDEWLRATSTAGGLRLIASLAPGAKSLREVLRSHPQTTAATMLIGPEGDFAADETSAALSAGFLPVSLGRIVLRVETAALFCVSALRYEFSQC